MSRLLRPASLYLLVSVLAGLAMISSESLWIDEGETLRFAKAPSLAVWWQMLRDTVASEAQMPLGVFCFWVSAQITGLGEWAFRSLNLLWVGLAGIAVGLTGRQLKQPLLLPLFLVHPFLWFYANEARPYAMQICAGAWLLYVLARWQAEPEVRPADLWLFGAAAAIGCGASMLFTFVLIGVVAVAGWWWWRGEIRLPRTVRHCAPLACAGLLLALLAVYYAYTLIHGAQGAKLWRVSPVNLAFALYEALGFSGLGPPRNTLRELGRSPRQLMLVLLQTRFLAALGVLALAYGYVAFSLWRRRGRRLVGWLAALLALTATLLYAAATVVHFPFWGRHLAGLLPFAVLLVLQAFTTAAEDQPHRRARSSHVAPAGLRVALVTLFTGLALSSLMLRFSPAHRKDDYRAAARLAKTALAAGNVVWWSASEVCAEYYGLILAAVVPPAQLTWVSNPLEEDLARRPGPDAVFQSKPDIFDSAGRLSDYLSRNHYQPARQLPAFTVWTRPGFRLDESSGQP